MENSHPNTWRDIIGYQLIQTFTGQIRQLPAARIYLKKRKLVVSNRNRVEVKRERRSFSWARAMASMAGLIGSTQAVLEGNLNISGSTRLAGAVTPRVAAGRSGAVTIRAQQQQVLPADGEVASRRAVLGLVASTFAGGSFVQAVLAEARSIKVGPPPLPSGGLPGTLNSDEPRDLDIPYKERFYLQPKTPAEAALRVKESAQDILKVKELIDKKQWPYVQMDLRNKASYLRYDLKTVIAAKPKEEKKALKELTKVLFDKIDELDYAAKIKSSEKAEKYYASTKSALDGVIAKLG